MKKIFFIAFALILVSCNHNSKSETYKAGPRIHEKIAGDIHYGKDICALTGDTISVVRYGAVLELKNGAKLKFNSAETMGKYITQIDELGIKSMQVVDFADGENLIDVKDAMYLKSKLRPSPGKMYITPIDRNNTKMLDYINRAYPGVYLEWSDLVNEIELTSNELKARTTRP